MTKKYESVADFAAFRQLRDDIARGFDQVAERVQQPGGNDTPGDLSGVFGKGLETFFSQVADGLRTAGDAVDEQTAAYSSRQGSKGEVNDRTARPWPDNSAVNTSVESGAKGRFASRLDDDQHMSNNLIEPLIDCCETDSAYMLMVDLPGVDPAAVELEVRGQLLTLSGVKSAVSEMDNDTASDGNGFNRTERAVGKFLREITLPADADCDSIVAESHHGVLTIKVSKAASQESRKITINLIKN